MARTPKREQTWLEMGQLQGLGLGRREIVSGDRDKFMVNTTHERVTLLTPHPDAEGFIRSDGRTLLFRHPSATIKMAIPEPLKAKAKRSKKSWEFAWGVLDDADIQALFAAVRTPAGRTG